MGLMTKEVKSVGVREGAAAPEGCGPEGAEEERFSSRNFFAFGVLMYSIHAQIHTFIWFPIRRHFFSCLLTHKSIHLLLHPHMRCCIMWF